MKNAKQIQALTEELETQKVFFELNGQGNSFRDRLAKTGLPERIDELSPLLSEEITPRESEDCLKQISSLLTPGFIRDFIFEEASRFTRSPIYTPATQFFENDAFSGVVFHTNRHVQVSVVALPPITRSLKQAKNISKGNKTGATVQGNDVLLTFIRAGNTELSLWAAEPFDHAAPLGNRFATRLPGKTPADGESVFLEGGRHAVSVKQCENPVLMILTSRRKTRVPVTAHYQTEDGSLYSCSASNVTSSRAQLLATAVRELGFQQGFPSLISLIDHPDHFVRWHIMREVLSLDLPAAKPYLSRMASDDTHPQVREVANQSLKILSEA